MRIECFDTNAILRRRTAKTLDTFKIDFAIISSVSVLVYAHMKLKKFSLNTVINGE